jgi:hypothetical protein
MLSDEERSRIAEVAVRRAVREEVEKQVDWKIVRFEEVRGVVGEKLSVRSGEVFIESPSVIRREIGDFIIDLTVDRDEWKLRAERAEALIVRAVKGES